MGDTDMDNYNNNNNQNNSSQYYETPSYNIKVTYYEDMLLAEAIIGKRKENDK